MNSYQSPYGTDFSYDDNSAAKLFGHAAGEEVLGPSNIHGWFTDREVPFHYIMSLDEKDGIYTLSCHDIRVKKVDGMVVTPMNFTGSIVYDSKAKKVVSNTLTAALRENLTATLEATSQTYGFPLFRRVYVDGDVIAHCFAAKVLEETKPYCFKAVASSKVFFTNMERHTLLTISNILSSVFDYADELEKILKISPRTVKDGWTGTPISDVLTTEKSKVPPALLAWANKQSCPTQVLGVLQTICRFEDPNNAVIFQNYFKALKRLGMSEGIREFCNNFKEVLESGEGYTTKKLIDYLIRQTFFYGEFNCPTKECKALADYIEMAKTAGLEYDHYPQNAVKSHNIMMRNMDALELSEEEQKAFEAYNAEKALKYELTIGDYVVVLPKTVADLVREGNDLNHCVAGYSRRIARKETLVGFLRKKDAPDVSLYTIEINDSSKVIQAKGACNEDVPPAIEALIHKIERSWKK